ncbi:MAG: T9SS type A sorting domain-containing protein [Leptolyngbya sp. SIO3F4]|nr:T9SS type A sorting domain-containing protein [Leptolyngbya sp. SIO3F4]
MKTKLVSLLLLVPFFASSQHIAIPNNYPVFTYNSSNGTDHTTDVHNYVSQTLMTGYFEGQTEFWGYDASSGTNVLINSVSDLSNTRSFFASSHDGAGSLVWFITSLSSGSSNAYNNSKVAYDANSNTYLFCVQYDAGSAGTPIEFFSSASGLTAIAAPAQYGLLSIVVDATGAILSICSATSSASPVILDDVDVDVSNGMMYATGFLQIGASAQAYILSYMPATCAGGTILFPTTTNNSWGRGIDVEASEVFVTGDFESTLDWGSGPVTTAAFRDVFVLRLNSALTPGAITSAQAVSYAEAYDVDVLPGWEVYVSGSIRQASAWAMGSFGIAPPGALHGFIQLFDPFLVSTCTYSRVLATGPGEFFQMVDLEINTIPPGTPGLLTEITIAGNMNHANPVYEAFGGCAVILPTTTLTAPSNQAGFVLQVDPLLPPVWTNFSSLTTSATPPTVTSVSSYERDIFVGGYKNDVVTLLPTSTGDFIPNLGNTSMNAFYTYIFSNGGVGDFLKTATSVAEEAEEEKVSFAVYPNPANEVLYLRIEDDVQLEQVILKDLAGRDIRFWNGQEAAGGLSIGDVPAGIYFLEVEGKGIRSTERVVIQ